ncbi:MAG: right-handed parallel beta-helix repeat-containing protein [Thermofilaceae archaeon]
MKLSKIMVFGAALLTGIAIILLYRYLPFSSYMVDRTVANPKAGECRCDGESVIIYVSQYGSDSWSGLYPDPLPDGSDGPLASLAAARDQLRKLRKAGKGPATVLIRGGTYYLESPLVFTPEDSGCKECPVVWQAYPGERPVISGGKTIIGFSTINVNGKAAWVTRLPEVAKGEWIFKQLFVNGKRRPRARLPKEGFFRVVEVPAYAGRRLLELQLFEGADEFIFNSSDVRAWGNLLDTEVVILHFWVEERIPVVEVVLDRKLVKLASKTVFAIRDGFAERYPRYYIENIFEALSESSEWYLDRSSGELLYLPEPGEEPETSSVIAPRLVWRLLELKGDPERGEFVENIVLRGLTFEHADWVHTLSPQAGVNVPGAIYLEGARNIVIENCTIHSVGGFAVEVGHGCRGVKVAYCELYDLGAGGIKVGTQYVPKHEWERTEVIDILGNHIHDCGRVFYSAVGIWVGQARLVRVLGNWIHDLYYTGISVGWTWGYGESFTGYNLVEGNHIHDIGKGLLSDMGGIYTLGAQPGTVIRCNIIHDIQAYQYGGWGIYLDEGSSYIVVEGNVVYDTTHGCFHQHYGRNNTVRDNIFALGGEANVVLSRGEPGQLAVIFERNIILSNGSPAFLGGYAQDFLTRNVISDRNLFWDLTGKLIICKEQRTGKVYTLDEWHNLGYDLLSLVADPMFVDTNTRNFTLMAESPVFKLGFKVPCKGSAGALNSINP